MGLVTKEEFVLVFLIMTTLFGSSISSLYLVGDSAGWTSTGNVDYNSWAASRTFFIGDTLLFEYDKLLHNVLQVQRDDYHSCNVNGPIAIFTSGNDSFTIGNHGHFFFLCGIPGHCEAAQKLDIRVPRVQPLPQASASQEMVIQTRVRPAIALPPEAAMPSRLIALPPYVESAAGALAFSRVQIALSLFFVLLLCGYVS